MDELKPCPFCGGEARMYEPEEITSWPDFEVICQGQWCDARFTGNSVDDAAKCWNTRHVS